MWLSGGASTTATMIGGTLVRYFSQKCAVNVRKINPKVSPQEASFISQGLYDVIKQHGPLTVSNTWTHAKEASISGLNSKTHMKIMLKWMRGRKMLKLFCNQVGSSKKFLHCTLPEEPQSENSSELKLQTERPTIRRKKPSGKGKKPSGKGKKPSGKGKKQTK